MAANVNKTRFGKSSLFSKLVVVTSWSMVTDEIHVFKILTFCATGCTIAFEERENIEIFVCLTENGMIARYIAKQQPKSWHAQQMTVL